MSILETISKVHEAERQAGEIVEAARRRERESTDEARRSGESLLDEARSGAEEEILRLREETARRIRLGEGSIKAAVQEEKARLKTRFDSRFEAASTEAADLFLSLCLKR